MKNYNLDSFKNGLDSLQIELSENQINQFLTYYELLIEWNQSMNLTAITEFEDVICKHFLDSLSIVKIMDMNHVKNLIDIGTGAGFPGVPLKIAFPNIQVILLDSLNKRLKFLNEVIDQLGLSDIKTIHGRAEDYGNDIEYREKFDLCVSRAVANLSTLSELCIPFVKKDGFFISYKSEKASEELSQAKHAIFLTGGELCDSKEFVLEGSDFNRNLIKIKKKNSTSKKYPRKAGLPGKSPL